VRERKVSVETVIEAPAERVFEILADPRKHIEIDGSDSLKGTLQAPKRLAKGERFGMSMKVVVPYRITNVVVEFVEGREIAWRHAGRHVWRYQLIPLSAGGTRVIESFEWDKAPLKHVYETVGLPRRNERAMKRTLENLRRLAESAA